MMRKYIDIINEAMSTVVYMPLDHVFSEIQKLGFNPSGLSPQQACAFLSKRTDRIVVGMQGVANIHVKDEDLDAIADEAESHMVRNKNISG